MAIIELVEENDIEFVRRNATGVVLMDFYANWCLPCKRLSVELEELQNDISIPVWKIEIENHPNVASQFGIMSVPTLAIVSDGEILHISTGFKTKEQILELVSKYTQDKE